MAGFSSDACPHCGISVDCGNLTRHVRLCLADPDVRRRVLVALTDPADPTRALSGKRYNEQREIHNVPNDDVLLKQYGGTWAAVCAEYGLEPPSPYRGGCIAQAPCPHCGSAIGNVGLKKHVGACIRNPAVREAVLCCLRDPQNTAHATSAERYNARRTMFSAPSDRTLVMQYDGKWESVCTDFGIKPPLTYSRRMDKVQCEYCGSEFATGSFGRHSPVCPKDPAHFDAIRATLQADDYPEYAVGMEEYRERARLAGIAGADTLKDAFGSWREAVEYFGLIPVDNNELQQRRAMAKVIALAAREARLLREDAESAGRFVALHVYDLPGVTVNGKPCQRVVLR